ncbi:hypothetical protein FQR65_LT03986 [Abscondita terminalis]|nr:hypothetical protein FQR65_LT03986 [Abscondita terminalis]
MALCCLEKLGLCKNRIGSEPKRFYGKLISSVPELNHFIGDVWFHLTPVTLSYNIHERYNATQQRFKRNNDETPQETGPALERNERKVQKLTWKMADLGPELVDSMFPTTDEFRQLAYWRDVIGKAKEHAAENQARKAAEEQAKKDSVDQILVAQDPGISNEDFEDILRFP